MNYAETIRYLFSLGRELAAPTQPAAAKFNLENMRILAEHLGRPERLVPCIHIAGTNGKGSTAAMLESILRAAGLRTGLYTSPHLERINERIRINGQQLPDDNFAPAFSRLLVVIEELLASGALRAHPTYFECLTAMALASFAGERLDFAVIEAGLGGRLDATNIVVPEVSVITQIDFDHENFLGHSIEEIACEKAGIIKPGVPIVTTAERPEALAVLARRAAELAAPFIHVDAAYRVVSEETVDGCSGGTIHEAASGWDADIALPLPGRFQLRNALAAVACARLLAARGYPVDESAIVRGLARVRWPGRLELLRNNPDVILDGAHNPAAARELAGYWEARYPLRRIHLVYGALRDKAIDEVAGILFPRAATVIITQPPSSRAISAHQLAEMTGHFAARLEIVAEPEAALERSLSLASSHDVVFIAGSLFLVGALRRHWFSAERMAGVANA